MLPLRVPTLPLENSTSWFPRSCEILQAHSSSDCTSRKLMKREINTCVMNEDLMRRYIGVGQNHYNHLHYSALDSLTVC